MNDLRYVCDDRRHLICLPYTVPNLHRMAADLGIKRCWYHSKPRKPHYDVPKRRVAEVREACHSVVTAPELVTLMQLPAHE